MQVPITHATRTDGLLAALKEIVPISLPCVITPELAATIAAVGHLITRAGLVLMGVLPAARHLVVLTPTVLLRVMWTSISRVNLR